MLIEKISPEELLFMETWFTPQALIESLFSNFDHQSEFDENKFGQVRLYQNAMLSYEGIIDEKIEGLNEKEQFELRKGAGEVFGIGARRYGKTMCIEKLDVPISMLYDDGWWVGFSAPDGIHLKDVLDVIKKAIEYHPILSLWKLHLTKAPKYEFEAKNGWRLDGINMNVKSKSPGTKFFGKHVKKLWIEECSLETEEVATNRRDSLSELGGIFRFSGMTNFLKYSPTGKVFFDPKNQSKIVNFPQFVNPFWTEEEREERLKEFGGEDTPNYRVFVKGEVLEDGLSEIDMDRVKDCYQMKKRIKRFEIKKEDYKYFKNLIVVERPKNAERIFICADIGESAGTDISIFSEVEGNYSWIYNIILYNLKRKEQLEVFKFLIEKLESNIIGLDCGDCGGRDLADDLEDLYSEENVVRYAGARKINVGFKKDKKNKILLVNGKPVIRQEFMSVWSVSRLKTLLYNTRIIIPFDYKLDDQLNSIISTTSGTRKTYPCISQTGDHLYSGWRVFTITQWLKADFNQTPVMQPNWSSGVSSWKK